MKIQLGGVSNYKGFKIYDVFSREIKSKNFSKKETTKDLWVYYFCFNFFYIVMLVALEKLGLPNLIIVFVVVISPALYFIFLMACDTWKQYQWHAAEHMVINLLEKNGKLNIKNLRKMPKESEDCGSGNKHLTTPSEKILQEALEVGKKYIRLANTPSKC